MADLIITGGRVIDPARGFDETADVLISEGRVKSIETRPGGLPRETTMSSDTKTIDAEGCIVAPGLLDIHVHFREPSTTHEETIATGSASALNGGFTTVCCMPNTTPPLDSAEMIQLIRHKSNEAKGARVFPVGCATIGRQGNYPAPIEAMTKAGAIGFTDDGDPVDDSGVLAKVFTLLKKANRVFMQHCQDPSLTKGASMNAGPIATKLGLTGWPRVAEEQMLERDILLNQSIGARYHAQHLSSGGSVEILRRGRQANQPVSGEVSPHHLLLTEEACDGYDTQAKMNPPLRSKRDIDQLKEAVAQGVITVLATDHAPHPAVAKNTDFESAAFGIVGVECALPLYIKALIDDNVLDWPELLRLMTINPAQIAGLDIMGLGSLAEGGPADITIIDPDLEWTIDINSFVSKGLNCPFDGWNVKGRSIATIVEGEVRHSRSQERLRT
ncbi:MAG: dihydroorotase [Planctomycetota bacterium]|nr:dihydroorotase [Planctomycetota bacterium]